ncbi:MAG: hypothetical protein Q9163_005807 [Psora crenata]
MDLDENRARSLRGELYHAFARDLVAARRRCKLACDRFNNAGDVSRRRQVELWREIVMDDRPLPPPPPVPVLNGGKDEEVEEEQADEAQFEDEPWIEGPIRIDYGTNVRVGKNVFINFNCVILDTCSVTIGSRTLIAANVSIFSATHPLDPVLRNGTRGPEFGKEVHIGDDCFIGGGATILPGVTIGNGVTVGAATVVTKDVPPCCVVAGNPARVIRRLEPRARGGKVWPEGE